MTPQFSDETMQKVLSLLAAKAEAELLLLANLTPAAPRHGLWIVERFGITARHFGQDDLQAIFVTLDFAQWRSHERRVHLCRHALRSIHAWDDNDLRPFIHGRIWGPGSLATLFHRVAFDRTKLEGCARTLKTLYSREISMTAALQRSAA